MGILHQLTNRQILETTLKQSTKQALSDATKYLNLTHKQGKLNIASQPKEGKVEVH